MLYLFGLNFKKNGAIEKILIKFDGIDKSVILLKQIVPQSLQYEIFSFLL